MAKEVKKGTKKVASKVTKKTEATKKAAPKRVVRKVEKEKSNIISIVYNSFLVIGVIIVGAALALKFGNYIETSTTLTCLGIALILVIISLFVKKINE